MFFPLRGANRDPESFPKPHAFDITRKDAPHDENADSVVAETNCSLTFNTTGLLTDQRVGQEFPEGTVTIAIDDDDTPEDPDVTATLTFDGSSVITIAIDGVNRFTFDVTTRTLTSIAP